jgi:hypothetical protein
MSFSEVAGLLGLGGKAAWRFASRRNPRRCARWVQVAGKTDEGRGAETSQRPRKKQKSKAKAEIWKVESRIWKKSGIADRKLEIAGRG